MIMNFLVQKIIDYRVSHHFQALTNLYLYLYLGTNFTQINSNGVDYRKNL